MTKSIYEKLEINVCKVLGDDEHGTGFLISNELILTAFHVVDGCDDIKVTFDNTEELNVTLHELIDDKYKELDIAILKLEDSVDFYENIKIVDSNLIPKTNWISRGYPQIQDITGTNLLKDGNIINQQLNNLFENKIDIQLDMEQFFDSYSGLSGAPLILEDKIVGLINSELLEKHISKQLNALSTKYFKDLLEELGISIETKQYSSTIPLTIENNILDYLDKHFESNLENDNNLKVYAPKLDDKGQDIENFVNELYESIHTFIGNRRDLSSSQPQRMGEDLRKKFKENFSNSLLEELIGYNLLESDLNAPKIFTSIDQGNLKSSIHLHDCNSEKIFVLSLPIINKCIDESIDILKDFIDQNIEFKMNSSMITEAFLRNSFNDEQKEYIETLIIPSKTPNSYDIEKAFGLFLGFDLSEIENKDKMKNSEFKKAYEKKILDMSDYIKEYIESSIIKAYSSVYFFVYLIPFDSTEVLITESERILSE